MDAAPPALPVPSYTGPDPGDFRRALASIDGRIVPLDQAAIPIRDFGLTRADMTYEVVHVWNGGFFRLDDHLDRFAESLQGFRLDPGLSRQAITALLADLVRRSGLRFATVWFACTRGVPAPGSRDPRTARNALHASVAPLVPRTDAATMARGLAARIHPTIRRIPPDSLNPRHKNTHWGDLTRAEFEVRDDGYDLPLLLDRDGFVTEGNGCNVMALVDGELVTPDAGCLEGVAAMTMAEIARDLQAPVRYARLHADRLRGAAEAFITSTTCGLTPLTRIDDRIMSNGRPGPLTLRLLAEYYRRKDAGWRMTPVAYD